MALLFCKEFCGVVAVFVFVDDDVLGGGDKAVLYSAISAETLLIGSGVEETNIERLVFLQFGQEYCVGARVCVIVVFAVAGKAAEEDTLVFTIPMVNGQHYETLVDAPCVG